MDKSIELAAACIIENATIARGEIQSYKTEWQIGIEERLDGLSTVNAALSSQVTQLQFALAAQAEAFSQRR